MNYEHLADEIERLAEDFAAAGAESPPRAEAWNLIAEICQANAGDIVLALRTLSHLETVQSARLDEVHAGINALGGYAAEDDARGKAVNETVGAALRIVEEAGGSQCLPLAMRVRHLEGQLAAHAAASETAIIPK